MIWLQIFLIATIFIWVRRAILVVGSIKKYSIMPIQEYDPNKPQAKVSVIIPCRNEARNIPILLPSLLKQDYKNAEFIFIDDRSEDNTYDLLKKCSEEDPRVIVLKGKPLPDGWTGKNNAMQQCADKATGDWLLFTDADTEHSPFSVSSAIHYAHERSLDLLTLSARCVCKSFGEHLVQPMGIGCFSVWFKLDEVNDPNSSTPLCCGQYLMIKKKVYDGVGGSSQIKDAVTEDLALFKVVKSAGHRCELAIGGHIFATRMYQSFKESWVGWRRIYLHAFDKNVPALLHKVFMLFFTSFLPFVIVGWCGYQFSQGHTEYKTSFYLSAFLTGFILFLRSRSHAALKAKQWSILLHPLSALTIIGIICDGLRHHFTGKKVVWKSQHY